MIIIIFGLIDLIMGGALLLSSSLEMAGVGIVFTLGIVFLLKALYSIITALAGGFAFDILGWVDLAGAISLMMIFWGFSFGFFFWIGVLVAMKGVYSIVIGLIAH